MLNNPMTLLDLTTIHSALNSCSGSVKHLHEGKPIDVSFRFTGKTRLAIADAVIALEPKIKAFGEAKKACMSQHGGPWEKDESTPAQAACRAELDAMLAVEVESPKFALPLSEFIDDANPVPSEVIRILRPFLK